MKPKFKIGDMVWVSLYINKKIYLCNVHSISTTEPWSYGLSLNGGRMYGYWAQDKLRLLSDCPEYMKVQNI